MSLKLSAMCWELQLSQAQRTVLKALADSADDDGSHCYPGIPYLAWKTDYDERSVRRILRQLEVLTYIEIVGEAGAPGEFTQYQLHFARIPQKPPYVRRKGGKLSPRSGQPRGDKARTEGGQSIHRGGTNDAGMGDISSTKQTPLPVPNRENAIRPVVNPVNDPKINPSLRRAREVQPVLRPSALDAAERAVCPVHAAMVEVAGGEPLSSAELATWDAARRDAIARALAAGQDLADLADEYRERGARYRRIWPHLAVSAVAVWRHWTTLATEPTAREERRGPRGGGGQPVVGQAGGDATGMIDMAQLRRWRGS